MKERTAELFSKRKVMLVLNAVVCTLIPVVFFILLAFALSSCATRVTVRNPVMVPEIPKDEVEELRMLLIDEPQTQKDLMNNLYVTEGLLYVYVDYTDALEGYIEDISSDVFEE